MNVEDLIRAGESYGYRRPNTTNVPATNTTSAQSDSYLGNSLQALSRIPRELGANVKDLVSRYGETAATMAAGMLPGAGYVQASQDFAHGRDALQGGEYGTAAANYGQGALNTVLETLAPYAPSLAMAAVPARSRAETLQNLSDLYARPQPGHSGQLTPYAQVKSDTPFEQMTRGVVDDPNNALSPWKEADLQAMVGGYGIPLVGDRTEAGKILQEINGQRLAHDVRLEGGYQYPQSAASRGPNQAAWASHANPITTLANRLQKVHKAVGDAPVYGIYSGMAERSGDFSTMNADAMMGLIPGAGMSQSGMEGFDKLLRARLEADGLDAAAWPGLNNQERARALLLERSSGDLRKAFMETADKRNARDLGMPDAAAVRSATTAPFLRDWTGSGASGGAIVRFDPSGRKITNPSIEHGTYPHQYPGEYMGGLPVNIDRNEMFPRTVAEQFGMPNSKGKPKIWANVDRTFMTNAGLLEKFDNEWMDVAMKAIERRKREGQ